MDNNIYIYTKNVRGCSCIPSLQQTWKADKPLCQEGTCLSKAILRLHDCWSGGKLVNKYPPLSTNPSNAHGSRNQFLNQTGFG